MSAVTVASPQTHKHRIVSFIQTQVYKLLFAHLGKFTIVAVYYICTQWLHGQTVRVGSASVRLPQVKQTWDTLLSASVAHGGLVHLMSPAAWDSMRHIVFRGVLEGVLGVVLYNQIGFNAEKYRENKKAQLEAGKTPGPLNRIFASPYQHHPVTGLQYAFLPVLLVLVTIVVGVPMYLGVHYGLAHAAHWTWLEPHLRHSSFWQRVYVGDYDGLLVGIATGMTASRTYRAYLFANTMNYSRRWVARGRGPKWWMPRPTRLLIAELRVEGVERQRAVLAQRNSAAVRVAAAGTLVFLALSAYGFYILKTFAH